VDDVEGWGWSAEGGERGKGGRGRGRGKGGIKFENGVGKGNLVGNKFSRERRRVGKGERGVR
jgi:hypothetical protein